jgi:hypothetical protein
MSKQNTTPTPRTIVFGPPVSHPPSVKHSQLFVDEPELDENLAKLQQHVAQCRYLMDEKKHLDDEIAKVKSQLQWPYKVDDVKHLQTIFGSIEYFAQREERLTRQALIEFMIDMQPSTRHNGVAADMYRREYIADLDKMESKGILWESKSLVYGFTDLYREWNQIRRSLHL